MMSIRILTPADAEAWAALRFRALTDHPFAFGSSPPDDPRILVETARQRLAPSDGAAVFGAFVDDALVGVVGVRRYDGLKERHKALVWGMYVDASHRRCGAGEALMRTAIEHASTWSDIEQIRLAVSAAAPEAQRLYERLGFRAWGREPRAIRWNGECADEIHMVLDVA